MKNLPDRALHLTTGSSAKSITLSYNAPEIICLACFFGFFSDHNI